MKRFLLIAGIVYLAFVARALQADESRIEIFAITDAGSGPSLGTVTVAETPYGLLFTPSLNGLAPGLHGFHIHETPSCAPGIQDGKPVAGLAAGGHWDPAGTGLHEGPYGRGHLGDLPALAVTDSGTASYPVLAPRLKKLTEIGGRSLMIHAGGDTHSDHPAKLGGGGARIACGVIP
jgi:Cu-Zn family superoxide dismutase